MVNLLCADFIVSLLENICLLEKTLLDYTNLFSPNDHKKNDKIVYKYFNNKYFKSQFYIKK